MHTVKECVKECGLDCALSNYKLAKVVLHSDLNYKQ